MPVVLSKEISYLKVGCIPLNDSDIKALMKLCSFSQKKILFQLGSDPVERQFNFVRKNKL